MRPPVRPKRAIEVVGVLFFLFHTILGQAQKAVKRLLLDDHISSIQINAEQFYLVTLRTVNNEADEISLSAKMEGEYGNDIQLNTSTQGETMFITSDFQPTFSLPNDKLGAHKVISVAIEITVPPWKNVTLTGGHTRVVANGAYEELNIVLAQGDCYLKEVTGGISVRSDGGNITVADSSGKGTIHAKYGTVYGHLPKDGNGYFHLSTTTGNVYLPKIE